jgi:hypothetical protein
MLSIEVGINSSCAALKWQPLIVAGKEASDVEKSVPRKTTFFF